MEMGDPSNNEVNANEFDLVPRMRIDLTLLPVNGRLDYNYGSIESCITFTIQQLVGDHSLTLTDSITRDVHLPRPPVNNRVHYGDEHYRVETIKNQLKYGNPGYFFVRDLTFVDRFPGDNWDQKFYNARQFIIQEMHCMNFEGQLLLTHLNPSEDALRLINLIPHDDSTPTVILKGVPLLWLHGEPSMLNLCRLFESLGKVRDIHMCRQDTMPLLGHILIQYEDKEEFSKAIKRLCSHSLKLKKNGFLVDYELSLKDSLTLNASQEVLTYIDNGYNDRPSISQALNYPMAMLEKELKTVKALMEEKVGALYNYNPNKQEPPIQGFKHRVAMLEKEVNTLKALTEKSGAGNNYSGDNESHTTEVHQVAILDKEVNTLKAVMEEYSVAWTETSATQALKRQLAMLEQRVTMLEKERNSMKTAS